VQVQKGLGFDTDRPAEPSAKTIHGASLGSPQVMLCFASAHGKPRSLSFSVYVQVLKGLGADTDRKGQPYSKTILQASSRLRPRAARIATAPGTLVLFHSVHVAEGLSADTDHPAEPSAKTFHGASSGSQQVLLCFCLCTWGTSFPFILCLCTCPQGPGRRHPPPSSTLGKDNSPGQLPVAPKGCLHCNCTNDIRSVSFCACCGGAERRHRPPS